MWEGKPKVPLWIKIFFWVCTAVGIFSLILSLAAPILVIPGVLLIALSVFSLKKMKANELAGRPWNTFQSKKAEELGDKILNSAVNHFDTCKVTHIEGLPISRDAEGQISLLNDCFKISFGSYECTLAKSKIYDVSVKTESEIQQQYVSSLGRAAFGGVLLGPIGIILGGRARKKTVSQSTERYLFIIYKSDNEFKCLTFKERGASIIRVSFDHFKNDFKEGVGYAEKVSVEL